MAFHQRAIHRHPVTGNHSQPVTDFHPIQGDLVVPAGSDLPGGGWRQVQQGLDGTPGAAVGSEFKHLAQEYEYDDHG
jgi:hypothetical protein